MELIYENHLFFGKAGSFLRTIEIIAQLGIVRKWELFVVTDRGYCSIYLLNGYLHCNITVNLQNWDTIDICFVLVSNILVNMGDIVQYWSGIY